MRHLLLFTCISIQRTCARPAYQKPVFADYEGLRGGTQLPRWDLRSAEQSQGSYDYANFEFEDLLSYSYFIGQPSDPSPAALAGGFGTSFTLSDMNFGRIKVDGVHLTDNSGSDDGYFVQGSQFRGYLDNGYAGISVAGAGDIDGDGVDDVLVGAFGARHVYVLFGKDSYSEFRRQLSLRGKFDAAINALPFGSVVVIESTSHDKDDGFGEQVASAGDINGDGYDDILVGAPTAKKNKGRVYVIYGAQQDVICCRPIDVHSDDFSLQHGFLIEGDNEGDFFGSSVAGGFDFDNDGKDDFLIGANGYNEGEGVALLVYGTAQMDQDASSFGYFALQNPEHARCVILKIVASDKGASIGTELAALDDVNGDGYDDIAIGADSYGRNGAVFVVLGGEEIAGSVNLDELDGSDGFGVLGATKGDMLGVDVKKAGDFNGDGYGDIVIGAPGYKHGRGIAYVVFGRNRFLATVPADLSFEGVTDNDLAGFSVSTAGDVDGDGMDDVLIGAFTSSPHGLSFAGSVYCVLGGSKKYGSFKLAELNGFDGFTMYGGASGDFAGYDVGPGGDFNDDGVDDIVVGAFRSSAGVTYGGTSFVVYGTQYAKVPTTLPTGPSGMPTPLPTSADYHLTLAEADGTLPFPASVSLLEIPNTDAGVFFYAESTLTSVALSNDIDGDGIDDVLIAADGAGFLVYGEWDSAFGEIDGSLDAIPIIPPVGYYATKFVAPCSVEVVSSAGDFNDDGLDDVLLGCPTANSGTGMVFLVLGSDSYEQTVNLSILVRGVDYIEFSGHAFGDSLGESLSSLDFNSDGYDDVAVGAPGANEAYIFYGMPTTQLPGTPIMPHDMLVTEGLTLHHSGLNSFSRLGAALAGVGDLNEDGFGDLVVGAPGSNTICVVLGNMYEAATTYDCLYLSPESNTPGFTSTLTSDQGEFGISVAKAGDVNGDSYADFIVGAPKADHESGIAFLYYGKSFFEARESIDNAVVFSSSLRKGSLGIAVAGGGDINHDGLDDLLLGADNSYAKSMTQPGTAYVVYGSASFPSAGLDVRKMAVDVGFTVTGTAPDALAGGLVAFGAFDVNSDSIDDLIVAQPGQKSAYVLFGMSEVISGNLMQTETPTPGPISPKPTVDFPTPSPTGDFPTPSPTGDFPTPSPTADHPTPLPTADHPTPLPTGDHPTPLPTADHPTPLPTADHPTPLPTGDQPTPLPTGDRPTPLPTANRPTLGDVGSVPPTVGNPSPSTATNPSPTASVAPSTVAPTSLQEHFLNADVAYVLSVLRIDNFSAAEFGDEEIETVKYAVFDVLGTEGTQAGLINSQDDVSGVSAVDIASIDLSFFVRLEPPSSFAADAESLVELVHSHLTDATSSGYLTERLNYWASYFGADPDISSVNTAATVANLDVATPSENLLFSLSTTSAPSLAPVISTNQPVQQPTVPSLAKTPSAAPSASSSLAPAVAPAQDSTPTPATKKSKKSSGEDSATAATIAVPIVVIIIVAAVCLYLYQMKLWCFADSTALPSDSAVEGSVPIEQVGQTQTHEVPLDEADMSVNQSQTAPQSDLAIVEAPPAGVTDVQEKIIEADL